MNNFLNNKTIAVRCNQSLQAELEREHQEAIAFQQEREARLNKERRRIKRASKKRADLNGACETALEVITTDQFQIFAVGEQILLYRDGIKVYEAGSVRELKQWIDANK
jgi:hypothetical protein